MINEAAGSFPGLAERMVEAELANQEYLCDCGKTISQDRVAGGALMRACSQRIVATDVNRTRIARYRARKAANRDQLKDRLVRQHRGTECRSGDGEEISLRLRDGHSPGSHRQCSGAREEPAILVRTLRESRVYGTVSRIASDDDVD